MDKCEPECDHQVAAAAPDSRSAEMGERASAEEMDEQREQNIAYEYLCRLEEAKKWIELCLREELPATTELEEGLRNGVFLAKLANFFSPKLRKNSPRRCKNIYDVTQARYMARGLHFRHTDNINYWISAMEDIGLPAGVLPETMDVYDRKNMPRVIYCVHALSVFLHSQGLAPKMHDLYGKVNFTEEEISAMRKELLKYGMDMPAFSTIGGILAAEIPIDEAALHASIIVINETIDKDAPEELLICLNNPEANLTDVQFDAVNEYCERLKAAKQQKSKECQSRANLPDVVHDAYDELLTRNEIQDCIRDANSNVALEVVLSALDAKDSILLFKSLRSPYLGLENVDVENAESYMRDLEKVRLVKQNNLPGESDLSIDDIQNEIDNTNRNATIQIKKKAAVDNINEMLKLGDAEVTLTALRNPDASLPPVYEYAAGLYQEEFMSMRIENQADLSYEELNGGIIVLSVVADINLSIESGSAENTYLALCNELAHIFGVSSDCKQRYQSTLLEAQQRKTGPCLLLTHSEIQECVDKVNEIVEQENARMIAIESINEALKMDVADLTNASLSSPSAGIKNVDSTLRNLYHFMMCKEKLQKASTVSDQEADLWVDEIQQIVDNANDLHSSAYQNCLAIATINVALDKGDMDTFELAIQNPEAQLFRVSSTCLATYAERLLRLKEGKSSSDGPRDKWVEFQAKDGISLFVDTDTMTPTWKPRESFSANSSRLSRDEIQGVLNSVTSEHDYQLLCKDLEPQIVKLQACLRRYLKQNRFNERLYFLHSQSHAVVKIQACWRGYRQRHVYHSRMAYLRSCTSEIIKVQSYVRMHLARKKYLKRLEFFRNQVSAVIKIQTFWRGNKTRKAFQELTTAAIPSFVIVRKFVHLLNLNNSDFSEELELHRLRGEVVKSIRHNQQLEKDLATMDIKIGLLVKNRITLQDVVAHGTKMNSKTKEKHESSDQEALGSSSNQLVAVAAGIKSLSKESHQKMDAYQHLFYALQTDAQYLSRLIDLQHPGRVNKFMESFILTLFNYASNQREEYLLLKLFKNALEDEIKSKVDQPQDIIVGNPTIIKMVVGFNRSRRGQGSLREILGSLVRHVLNSKDLHINTNPVDIYKSYVNQLETDSGQTSELPYNVTQSEALKHEQVRKEIEVSVACLKEHTLLFFDAILRSIDKIPYGILYMAKVMKTSLENKFPDVPQKEILKVVGNLLYYRYINSAIVAPDAFDIVDIGANEGLTSVQRTNLGSIAKILQFSTSKTGFDNESPHLVSLNPFIMECHEKFKKFFLDACNVPELEDQFKVDEYTEATMLAKPVIFISLQDICEIHSLLLEHQNVVAPSADDPLHELLEDLGSKPSVEALVGENPENLTSLQMAKIEVCLSLSNKFELTANSKDVTNRLFVRTKQMIVDTMHCIEASNITDMIMSAPTDSQRALYVTMFTERDLQTSKADDHMEETVSYRTRSDSASDTLDDAVLKTRHNLNMLELEGYVSSKSDYEEIVKAVALEIRNRRRYRIRRRQDLVQLRTTLANLHKKTKFHEEQVDYYNEYLKQCLKNMTPGSKKVRRDGSQTEKKKVKSMSSKKYTASKLHEKGVIVSMEGLAQNQFKNVLFEITPTDGAGVFVIKVKYMGTNLSQEELDIQDLLELQFEGISVTKLFDRAEVNVNLLLFLLNREFYGKSR